MGSGRLTGELPAHRARAAPQVVVKAGFDLLQPSGGITGKRQR